MNIDEKRENVDKLGSNFAAAHATFLMSYHYCSCAELTELRADLRRFGSKFSVVKNSLAKRAISGTEADTLADLFEGPVAVVWSGEDVVASAKAICDFSKGRENVEVKGAVAEGRRMGAAEVKALASMPSREESLAKLLSVINAPAVRLLQTLSAPATNFTRLMNAWKERCAEVD